MTNSEQLGLKYLKKIYPDAHFRKIADYKQTGSSNNKGLPDYFLIDKGITYWFEIKYIQSFTFNFSEIRESQLIEFYHFLKAGYDVNILIVCKVTNKYHYRILKFSEVLRLLDTQKSVAL